MGSMRARSSATVVPASIAISGLVAILVGFGGSVAIVLEAARAVGATPAQTSSWVAGLCLAMMATTAVLSVRHRIPVITAWSTPGAAVIAATSGVSMEAAVGAFILSAVLVLLTAAFRPLLALIERIPAAIASAMLAGVLLSFVLAIFEHLGSAPALVLPMVAAFALLRLYSPAWAVLAVLGLGVALAHILGMATETGPLRLSSIEWVTPVFDPAVLIGLGLPLYLITMASQNLPGFAVLRAAGYPVPARSILTVTGLASLLTAWAGAHSTNLSSITAAICTGPDTHPDKDKRWLSGLFNATGSAFFAAFGASVVALFASFPPALIATVAGIALIGPLVGALGQSLAAEQDRFAAVVTFAVTASGLNFFGIGAAFWGLVAGLAVYGLDRAVARRGS